MRASKALISSAGGLQQSWTSSVTTSSNITPLPEQPRKRALHTTLHRGPERQSMYTCRCPSRSGRPSRRFAHTSSSTTSADASQESYWPTLSPHKHPTPYDILSHPKTGAYNKRRFTYLVKLYHPDSQPSRPPEDHSSGSHLQGHPSTLPSKIRLQRYHLLIQAHTILSSPTKRAAYDLHGAGWASIPSFSDLRKENSARGWAAAREWERTNPTPKNCATWEDWDMWWASEARRRKREDHEIFARGWTERNRPMNQAESPGARMERMGDWVSWIHEQAQWRDSYARHHRQQQASSSSSSTETPFNNKAFFTSTSSSSSNGFQRPLYFSNNLFILLVASTAVAGAMYEVSRANESSKSYLAQLQKANEESWKHLNASRAECRTAETKEERVGRFLRERREDGFFGDMIAERSAVVAAAAAAATTAAVREGEEQ